MIEIKNKQIYINGKPELIMCGEIHYYRLKKSEWQDRIDKLKAAGCNGVATYVPWLCHEEDYGQIDLIGKTRPELDLIGFIDLCKENELYFVLRPGPFIMAEMKNEGLPYWLLTKYPEIIPVTWDGQTIIAKTIDYLAPHFLREVKRWYAAVMEMVVPRLIHNGGNIIGIQLDNEIGMLSWVNNSPDLTDHSLHQFCGWLKERYKEEEIRSRYPFNINNFDHFKKGVRSPKEEYASQLMHDLGYYMRDRFAQYVAILRSYCEEYGVKDIPFIINIHGTNGRGLTFPIGISQLYKSYTQDAGYISGSDIYFGDLDMNTFQDLYLINGFMDSVHREEQPLTSLEFNCGDGNFGSTYSGRYDPSAVDFKARMCVAQGNRMINYYLFSGGINYKLKHQPKDGNGRIAITGERHGFAAPINPEGELNYTYPRMARSIKTIMAVSEKLASMREEKDHVAFAFIPDYYMTESFYPKSEKMRKIINNLQSHRAHNSWEIVARAMLLAGYRFGGVNVQDHPLDIEKYPVIVLSSARYMDDQLQLKLTDYLKSGGCIFLYGEVPIYNMEGDDCTLLAEALGIEHEEFFNSSQDFYLSIKGDNWVSPYPEVRTNFAQAFNRVDTKVKSIFNICGTDKMCGFETEVGKGKAIVIGSNYTCDIDLFKSILEKLGAKASLVHDNKYHGIFMTSTINEQDERFIHMLNLDGFDKELHIIDNNRKLFDGYKIILQSKDALMLPINVTINDTKILYSTAEIIAVLGNSIEFRLTQPEDIIVIATNRKVIANSDYRIEKDNQYIKIVSNKHSKIDDKMTVYFK